MTTTETMRLLLLAVERVSKERSVLADAIMSKSRYQPSVKARWEVWRILHEDHKMSANSIAIAWGCNHATILHAMKALKATGTEIAEANRAECNKLTKAQRAELMERGMVIIYGKADSTHATGHEAR